MSTQQDLSFIQQQAYQWLVKLESQGLSAEDEAHFVAWMEQDERHGEAFYQAEQTWQLMHQAANESGTAETNPTLANPTLANPDNLTNIPLLRRLMPVAASLLVAITLFLFWQPLYFSVVADHYTATGDRFETELTDGSVITLNTDSAIRLEFDEQQRRIHLLEGELYVEVAKEAARPFVIEMGNYTVTALGTEFIVKNTPEQAPSVVVTEHSVRVENIENQNQHVVLQQGQKVHITETEPLSDVQRIDIEQAQSWRSGRYIFKSQPLGEVLAELDRYYEGVIVIRDKELAQKRVSGVLNLDEPSVSLNNLASSLALDVIRLSPYLQLVEKR